MTDHPGLRRQDGLDASTRWRAETDPEALPQTRCKDMEEQADMDGPLVDYKAKGHTVELLGKEKVEGSDAYKLKVTLKNGDVRTIYLDADRFLEVKTGVEDARSAAPTGRDESIDRRLQGRGRPDDGRTRWTAGRPRASRSGRRSPSTRSS